MGETHKKSGAFASRISMGSGNQAQMFRSCSAFVFSMLLEVVDRALANLAPI